MKTKVIIVDDEQGAREALQNILTNYFADDIEVIDTCGDIDEAFKSLTENKPNLVFLDIEMPKGGGFELLNRFDDFQFKVIFVTAFDQYAIKAIKFSALDYLLKPIDMEDLDKALQKFRKEQTMQKVERLKLRNLIDNVKSETRVKKVAVPDGNGLIFIALKDIIRCESDGNYTTIFTSNNKKVVASRTLGDYEDMFAGETFFRIHRSHLINLDHLQKYVKGEGGYVVMSDNSKADVSRRKKGEFLEFLTANPI